MNSDTAFNVCRKNTRARKMYGILNTITIGRLDGNNSIGTKHNIIPRVYIMIP